MTRPLKEADLIFPTESASMSSVLHSLKRSALSITNRLQSIHADSEFVLSVSKAYNLPLVANERCGSWYIPPEKKAEGVYFKSTDGHTNEWDFSLRRLNYQIFNLVDKHDGCVTSFPSYYVEGYADIQRCIIVDSTRRGKSG
jgi:tRNA A64-2'-O-ribosylphosphate transferase